MFKVVYGKGVLKDLRKLVPYNLPKIDKGSHRGCEQFSGYIADKASNESSYCRLQVKGGKL